MAVDRRGLAYAGGQTIRGRGVEHQDWGTSSLPAPPWSRGFRWQRGSAAGQRLWISAVPAITAGALRLRFFATRAFEMWIRRITCSQSNPMIFMSAHYEYRIGQAMEGICFGCTAENRILASSRSTGVRS